MPKLAPTNLAESLSPNAEKVLALIRKYQSGAASAVRSVQKQFGVRNLLSAVRRGRISKRGKLGRLSFSFHGVGCQFHSPQMKVDVDFGPDGRFDGFDAWRLSSFTDQHSHHLSGKQIERGLKELLAAGEIIAPQLEPSPHLFYLASSSV